MFARLRQSKVSLCGLVALAAAPAWAAAPLPEQWTRLVGSFDARVQEDHVVGASLALVQDGKIIAHHEYGFADQVNGRRVDADTIFHWASNTKTLNAISIMQLRDRGLLSLQDPITRSVPELRQVHNSFGSMDAITVAMLMSHTSGFQGATWPYKQGKDWEPFEPTRWSQLVAMMPYQELEFAPGSRFGYSNPAWIYLAHMLEDLTDDPWQYYIQKNIFAPLGMARSYFGMTPAWLRPARSHSYQVTKKSDNTLVTEDVGADFDPGITIPNGGWNAPLADVATYIGFLTAAGDARTRQRYDGVLTRSSLEEMWHPRVSTAEPGETESQGANTDNGNLGLGYFLSRRNGHVVVGHTGGQNDFSTFFYADPLTGRGIVGAFNTGNGARPEGVHSAFAGIRGEAMTVFDGSAADAPSTAVTYDVLIRNGTIVDGTGWPRYSADVLVKADTIAFVGKVPEGIKARRVIDATGKIVAPGFIDAHAHGDPLKESFANFLGQGITTVVLGQDGVTGDYEAPEQKSLAQWMRRVAEHRSEVNIAALSGHGTLRDMAGVGDNPVPSPKQLLAMQSTLRGDLEAGAFGMSFGLEYEPGRYAQLAEEKALGDLVGQYGGVVMSHMRSEDTGKIGSAIDELLQINAHVHVSHLKIVAGHQREEALAVLDKLARARHAGKDVSADVYPYLASASNFVFLYPDWAKVHKDYDEAVKTRRAELEAHIHRRVEERNGPEAILFVGDTYAGSTLADVARRLGKPYEKVIIDNLGYGGPPQAHFLMSASAQDEFITADNVCISTDGAPGSSHPRSYGSFIKVLEDYVGPAPKMTLEQAVYKMSGLTAQVVGIRDRGELVRGRKADILVLSASELHSRATWVQPQLQPSGLETILVNGQVALDHGGMSADRKGRMLKREGGRQS